MAAAATPGKDEALAIGLVGCGKWGRLILRDLKELGCAVTVVARSGASRQRATDGGAGQIVPSVADLSADLDGFVVATPTTTHGEMIERVLHHGRPIFVEKPMTVDPSSARRLAELAGDRLFVMEKWRYHPGVVALGKIVRDGELGPPQQLRTYRLGWGNPHDDTDAIWLLAPHDLSIAREILGTLPAPRAAVAELDEGVPVGLIGVLGDSPQVIFEVSCRRPVAQRSITLACRDGAAVLAGSYADHVIIKRNSAENGKDSEERRPIAGDMPLLLELRAFVEHLRGGPPPRASAAEGAELVACIAELRALAGLELPGAAP